VLHRIAICSVSLCLLAGLCLAQVDVNEKAAWDIWKMMESEPNDHPAVVAACEEFRKNNPRDPLIDVTRGIAAWHLLKVNDIPAAVKDLTSMLAKESTPLQKAADEMARTWLSRFDMEWVKRALGTYYRKEVQYPESLDALAGLPEKNRPPLTDRWGKPWAYSLVGFKLLEGFNNQKYTLRCHALGEDSDLADALEIPYAGRINLRPIQMADRDPANELIVFATTDESQKRVMLSERVAFGNIVLAYSGSRILILSDGNHWKFTARPTP